MLKIIINFTILILLVNSFVTGQQTVGLIINDTPASYDGYTLFAPNNSTSTYLIDINGRLVNKWESEYVPGLSAYLLEDGYLLRSAAIVDPIGNDNQTGGFQKFAWDNELVWEFYYGAQHHDIEPLPDGNVLLIANDTKAKDVAILAGMNPNLFIGDSIRSLSIVEVKKTGPTTGNIVWQWNAWNHLIQEFDNSKENYGIVSDHPELMDINFASDGGQDWLHTNSISYNEEFDQILISNRNTNEIWVIDHSITTEEAATHLGGNSAKGGDLLYRWGNPIAYNAGATDDQKLFGQHDANWIESGLIGEGNILIFNNGLGRPNGNYSSVEEIVLPVNKFGQYTLVTGNAFAPNSQMWIYTTPDSSILNSPRYGGSQRLPNGNTLICNSDKGEFFEVDNTNEIVWKYINPVVGDSIIPQGTINIDNNHVFRCYRYGLDYPGLPDSLKLGEPLTVYDEMGEVAQFKLYNNYPNPFNPSTTITYNILRSEFITITVFDILGNKLKTLVNQTVEQGQYSIVWDSKDDNGRMLSSGIYFYNIQAGDFIQTKKMILLR